MQTILVRPFVFFAVAFLILGCLQFQPKESRPKLVEAFVIPILEKAPRISEEALLQHVAPDSEASKKIRDKTDFSVQVLNELFGNIKRPYVKEVKGPYRGTDREHSVFTAIIYGYPNSRIIETFEDKEDADRPIQVATLQLECDASSCKITDLTLYNPFVRDGAVVLEVESWLVWRALLK